MQSKKQQGSFWNPTNEKDPKIRLFLFAAFWIFVIAVVVYILTPRGTPLQNCMHALIASNKNQCLYELALSSDNSSLCSNLSTSYSESCYYNIAVARDNESLCGEIGNGNESAQCTEFVANATNTFGYCFKISGDGRDSCINRMALKDYNLSLCSALANYTNKSICSSSIDFKGALRFKNQTYCNGVSTSPDPVITSAVLTGSDAFNSTKVAGNLTGYVALLGFSSVGAQFSARDFCYMAYAAQYDNASACSSIVNTSLEGSCVASTTEHLKTNTNTLLTSNTLNYTQLIAACTASAGGNRTSCVSLITVAEALTDKNVSLCGTLERNYSYGCYTSFAQQFRNSSYCGFIKNFTVYNACVQNIYYNASAAANDTQTYP